MDTCLLRYYILVLLALRPFIEAVDSNDNGFSQTSTSEVFTSARYDKQNGQFVCGNPLNSGYQWKRRHHYNQFSSLCQLSFGQGSVESWRVWRSRVHQGARFHLLVSWHWYVFTCLLADLRKFIDNLWHRNWLLGLPFSLYFQKKRSNRAFKPCKHSRLNIEKEKFWWRFRSNGRCRCQILFVLWASSLSRG